MSARSPIAPPSCPSRLSRRAAWLALGLAALMTGAAAAAPAPTSPQAAPGHDLTLGVARFAFAQGHYRAAAAALSAETLPDWAEQPERHSLLLGRTYLKLGLRRDARSLLQDLLGGQPPPKLRVRAAFYLGRLYMQAGRYREATELLAHNPDVTPPAREAERLYWLSQGYLAQGAFGQAERTLRILAADPAPSSQPDWADFGRYNLAMALLDAGRLRDARRGLLRLVQPGPDRPAPSGADAAALRDRVNLALGYAELRAHRPEQALPALRRVRLHGPAADNALLALGWGERRRAKPRQALVAWLELTRRPAAAPAVQEAMLSVPTVLEEIGARREALTRYRAALVGYNQQLQHLDAARAAVKGGGFIAALRGADPAAPASPLSAPLAPYLDDLLTDAGFQSAWRDYRQLLALEARLGHWTGQLPAFRAVVAARRDHYAARRPLLEGGRLERRLHALARRRDDLARRLNTLLDDSNPAALANARERTWLSRVDGLARALDALSPARAAPLRRRLALVRGVLRWRLLKAYPARRQHLRAALADLDAALARARHRHRALREAWGDFPKSFRGFDRRLDTQQARLAKTRRELRAGIASAAERLRRLALAELARRRRHVASLRARTQFSLARLYDSLASGEDDTP